MQIDQYLNTTPRRLLPPSQCSQRHIHPLKLLSGKVADTTTQATNHGTGVYFISVTDLLKIYIDSTSLYRSHKQTSADVAVH